MPLLNSSNHFRLAVLSLITANVIWGAAPPIFKWALADIEPFTLAFIRFSIAAAIVAPFAYKHLRINREDTAEVFLAGFLGVAVNISFFFLGLKLAPSINASIISSAGPVFIMIASFFFLKEKFKMRLIAGSAIGLIGVLIIMLQPLYTSEPNLDLFGNFLFFLAMIGGISHALIGRSLMKKYDPLGITFWIFIVGSLCFLPMVISENLDNTVISSLTINSVVGIIFGAVFSSALAYTLFLRALKYMPAAESGVFLYIDPIITVLVAYPLLGEKPDFFYFLGALFVFAGIYIAEKRIHYHPIHLLKNKS